MPRALKIAVDSRPLSYRLTGIGVYLKFLLQALQEADHVNQYLLLSNGPIHFELTNSRWRKIEGSITKRLLSTLWMQLFGPWTAIRHRIDLFWSPRHHLPLLLPAGIPSILTIHDLTYRFYPHTMAPANYWVERLLMPPSAARANRVVTDARATARDLTRIMKVPAAKIRVIYPGPPELGPGYQADRTRIPRDLPLRYFLFVGTLDPRKNFAGLFEAFVRLNLEKENLHLVIAGASGWKNRDFHTMLKDHPAASRLHFTGYVNRDQLRILYQRAIALVFPSFYEGFGFPVLEAMAAGTPVITADRSSLPEVAGCGALQVDPHDIPGLTRAMQRMYRSPDLRRKLIAHGRNQFRRFSWQSAARQMLGVFQEVARA